MPHLHRSLLAGHDASPCGRLGGGWLPAALLRVHRGEVGRGVGCVPQSVLHVKPLPGSAARRRCTKTSDPTLSALPNLNAVLPRRMWSCWAPAPGPTLPGQWMAWVPAWSACSTTPSTPATCVCEAVPVGGLDREGWGGPAWQPALHDRRTHAAVVSASAAASRAEAAVAALRAELEEARDASEQQKMEAEAAVFAAPGLAEMESQRCDEAALLATARSLAPPGFDASQINGAFLLRKPSNDKPAPLVIRCASLAAKVALLRAARAAGGDLRVAARLTRWQQQQRAAFKPQLEQLKAEGTTVRFWRGHILQRQAPDGGWVAVQRAASQAAE
ncbi:hypothetical protein ABPG75_006028 [Micractinium tetrahymenae]